MFRTGRDCETAGVYRSTDCGYEASFLEGEAFPKCPVHGRKVTWTLVRKITPPRASRKRRQG